MCFITMFMFICFYSCSGSGSIMTSPRDRRGGGQGSSASFSEEKETMDRAAFLSLASSASPFPSSPPFSSFLSYSPLRIRINHDIS